MRFLPSIREEEGDDDDDWIARRVSRKLGPPKKDDWDKVRLFVRFLKLFHDTTLYYPDGHYVICNSFLTELVTI